MWAWINIVLPGGPRFNSWTWQKFIFTLCSSWRGTKYKELWPRVYDPGVAHSSISVHDWNWSIMTSDMCPNSDWYMYACWYLNVWTVWCLNLMGVKVLEYGCNGYMSLCDERVWKILWCSVLVRLAILDRNTLEHSSTGRVLESIC